MAERPFGLHELPEGIKLEFSIDGFAVPSDEAGRFGDADYVELELLDSDGGSDGDERADALSDVQRMLEEAGVDLDAAGSLAQAIQLETSDLVPQINLLSSGEQSAFTVEFLADFDDPRQRRIAVVSDGFSAPRMKSIDIDSPQEASSQF